MKLKKEDRGEEEDKARYRYDVIISFTRFLPTKPVAPDVRKKTIKRSRLVGGQKRQNRSIPVTNTDETSSLTDKMGICDVTKSRSTAIYILNQSSTPKR